MYSVNKAKFDAHPDLAEELMGTYPCEIRGGPSTGWTYMVSMFRIRIQMPRRTASSRTMSLAAWHRSGPRGSLPSTALLQVTTRSCKCIYPLTGRDALLGDLEWSDSDEDSGGALRGAGGVRRRR